MPDVDLPPKPGLKERLALLRRRDFLLLWSGAVVSMLGDAMSMIALPWLVIQLTDSSLSLGTVIATSAVPRALFILLGGALTDRLSPRLLMMYTKILFFLIVLGLSVLILTELIQLWMIYAFALLMGTVGAFAFPAQSAILPQLVEDVELPIANSIMGGSTQICFLVGPALGGILIVLLSGGDLSTISVEKPPTDLHAIGLVFAINAATFVLSYLTLLMIRIEKSRDRRSSADDSLVKTIVVGFSYLQRDKSMMALMFYIAAIGLLVQGPIVVGIPILASERFVEGAAAFGLLMSSHSGGALLGVFLAGLLPPPRAKNFGVTVLSLDSIAGFLLLLLGFATTTLYGMGCLFAMGVVGGFLQISFMILIQRRIPQELLGRIMSFIMFANMGLSPISAALAGGAAEYVSLTVVFACSGGFFSLVALGSMLSPAMRAMGLPTTAYETVEHRKMTPTPL